MGALARWSFRHRKWVLVGWLVVAVGVFLLSQAAGSRYTTSFALPNTDSTKALNLLQANAPAQSGDTEQVVVASANGATLDTPAVHARVDALLAKMATLPDVTGVVSPYSAGGHARMNASHTVAFANLAYGKVADSLPASAGQQLVSTVRSFDTPQLTVSVGGQVAASVTPASLGGVYYGVIAAAVVLFLVFGSLLAMTLPLLSAVLALFASLGVIRRRERPAGQHDPPGLRHAGEGLRARIQRPAAAHRETRGPRGSRRGAARRHRRFPPARCGHG